jgi:predicted RND superfamily exporter protein
LEEVDVGAAVDAPERAMFKAKGPCTLAAVTTAIGLASLCISEVEPVQQFGFLGAIGVLVCVGMLFLLVPGFMVIWLRRHRPADSGSRPKPDTSRSFVGFARAVGRHGLVIRIVCWSVMIGCSIGLTKLRTSIDVVSLLSPDNRAVQDFHWVEKNIGPLVPIEVVIHFDRECTLGVIDRLKLVAAVQHQISQIEILDGEMSAVTFIPNFPRRGGVGGLVRNKVFLRQIENSREDLIEGKYLAETDDGEAWRISGRILGQSDFDYGQFLDRLQSEIDPILAKVQAEGYAGVSATSTGVLVLVYQIQEALLDDLFNSFLTALLLVAIVMMFALRSVTCGLLAMLPNVFPTLVLFGTMGWSGHTIDIGSVMTASVALGIAVDGTFHFLKWFVQSLKQGESRETAITIAYQRCGPALIQTTIICACGLLIYSFSGFLPARHFAWVLLMMLVAALFGDMILLPALLAGGLGRKLSRIYSPQDQVAITTPEPAALTDTCESGQPMPKSNPGANLPE